MRPISFAHPVRSEHIQRSGDHLYVWDVVCSDGQTAQCTIRIPRSVRDRAYHEPGTCGPGVVKAVRTDGRSVIEEKILKRDDPPSEWVVYAEGIFEDGAPPAVA